MAGFDCREGTRCVSYRGYYNKDEALAYADALRAQHYDVQVGGVPAYSTLGWFDDPLLSTFINYNDAELARLIFHELAHQVVYVPGDSAFNESFASAVEEAGVQRWLAREGNDAMRASYAQYAARRQDFLALLLTYRGKLETVYASDASEADKRARKAQVFARRVSGIEARLGRFCRLRPLVRAAIEQCAPRFRVDLQ